MHACAHLRNNKVACVAETDSRGRMVGDEDIEIKDGEKRVF